MSEERGPADPVQPFSSAQRANVPSAPIGPSCRPRCRPRRPRSCRPRRCPRPPWPVGWRGDPGAPRCCTPRRPAAAALPLQHAERDLGAHPRRSEARRRMVARLGDLLRITLEHEETQEVTLREELDFLAALPGDRAGAPGGPADGRDDIAPETLDARVPHLILQPLVENAIRHGIAARIEPGRVEISAAAWAGRALPAAGGTGRWAGVDRDNRGQDPEGASGWPTSGRGWSSSTAASIASSSRITPRAGCSCGSRFPFAAPRDGAGSEERSAR